MRLRLRVGDILKERGMTPGQLALLAGIQANTARALVRGVNERLDVPVLNKVAAALGVRPTELFEDAENAPGQRIAARKAA